MMGAKLFLSYAKEDTAAARRLCKALRERNLDVWLDEDSLIGGQPWLATIERAIHEADFFVALLSDASVSKRGVVQSEIREALKVFEKLPAGSVFVLPVRLNKCEPSFDLLREIHWIDLFPDWEHGIGEILRSVQAYWKPPTGNSETPFEIILHHTPSLEAPNHSVSVRLNQLVHEVLADFDEYAVQQDMEIHLMNRAGSARVQADPDQMKLVLYNLLHNAVKYSYSPATGKGWVSVDLDSDTESVVVGVENVGLPIPQDEVTTDKIFEKGYRSRASAGVVGTGIGLWIARSILDQLGGKISVSSKALRGTLGADSTKELSVTRFEIRLPRRLGA
jgi:anti-sigma regulatory factor (Ser/Thr protein kinase)